MKLYWEEHLYKEMMEDWRDLYNKLEQFVDAGLMFQDRWSQITKDKGGSITEEQQEELDKFYAEFRGMVRVARIILAGSK